MWICGWTGCGEKWKGRIKVDSQVLSQAMSGQ